MTGVVERLGVDMIHTTEDEETRKKAQEQYKKKFGEYIPNEHFYEITHDQFANWMRIYNMPFSGCKVIIPVNGMRWEAMCSQPSKVIMMWRDPAEIRQSQEAFYKKARANYEGDGDPSEMAEAYLRTMLASTRVMLDRRAQLSHDALFDVKWEPVGAGAWHPEVGHVSVPPEMITKKSDVKVQPFDYKVVQYRDVLEDPEKEVREIAKFLGAEPDRIGYAASSVDKDKIRFKKEEL
ncbi:unnamed protein product, partial [marine sediment metagenome]